ncbi:ATP-binding protein [Alteromonas gracilis]|uniref:ATP-binding protein n=1 Tax=Alteromonas gracilis TaxID=1479524 RepID=UPI0037366B18
MQSKRYHIQVNTDVHALLNSVAYFARHFVPDDITLTEISTVTSELAYNIIKYAGNGTITLSCSDSKCVIEAIDSGTGMQMGIEHAFVEGRSSSGSLGLGMSSIVRMSDEFNLSTSDSGTCITCVKGY